LRVGHLEQVQSRDRAGHVHQRIDSSELREGPRHDRLGGLGIAKIAFDDERLRAAMQP
jgi:hypothetical protein